ADVAGHVVFFLSLIRRPACSTLFPYTTLFRSIEIILGIRVGLRVVLAVGRRNAAFRGHHQHVGRQECGRNADGAVKQAAQVVARSEEHTSELQSREKLVSRLLLEKKNQIDTYA